MGNPDDTLLSLAGYLCPLPDPGDDDTSDSCDDGAMELRRALLGTIS